MFRFLRDPIWQFIAAMLTLLALVVGTFVSWRLAQQDDEKDISYEVVSSASIVSVNPQVASRVRVTLDGSPVPGIRLSVFRVVNDGDLPVSTSDYEVPIRFVFGQGSVIEAGKGDSAPPQLPFTISFDGSSVRLSPLLLNPGDSVSFSVLARSDIESEWYIEGRIIGVKSIDLLDRREEEGLWASLPAPAFIAVGAAGWFFILYLTSVFTDLVRVLTPRRRRLRDDDLP